MWTEEKLDKMLSTPSSTLCLLAKNAAREAGVQKRIIAVSRFSDPIVRKLVLHRQGLLKGIWCLNPEEVLSHGQAEEIDRVCRAYPELSDDAFVKENLNKWM